MANQHYIHKKGNLKALNKKNYNKSTIISKKHGNYCYHCVYRLKFSIINSKNLLTLPKYNIIICEASEKLLA